MRASLDQADDQLGVRRRGCRDKLRLRRLFLEDPQERRRIARPDVEIADQGGDFLGGQHFQRRVDAGCFADLLGAVRQLPGGARQGRLAQDKRHETVADTAEHAHAASIEKEDEGSDPRGQSSIRAAEWTMR